MRIFHLKRIAFVTSGTFGVLIDGEVPFCLTLERLWLNNRRSESCIPAGNYYCKRIESPRFGDTFQVMNVENRSHILFHKGNILDDTHGCIILGEEFGNYKDSIAVISSGRAFKEFMGRVKGLDEFYLEVTHGN